MMNNEKCEEIITSLKEYDEETSQITRQKSLDEIQDEYFMSFKHMHAKQQKFSIKHMTIYCKNMNYNWKYVDIKQWWNHKQKPNGWWNQLPLVNLVSYKYQNNLQITTKHIPLTQFTVEDIVNSIIDWIQNDINYTRDITKTKNIFSKHELSGHKMMILSGDDARRIIKDEMLEFMTPNTLKIMFDGFDKWKESDISSLESKSAESIAHILYEFPLRQILARIRNERINGKKFIALAHDNDIIQQETGWNEDEVEQIHLLLFKAMVLSKAQFDDKIRKLLRKKRKDPTHMIMNEITQIINTYGVEQLQYDIKHNKDTQTFNDQVINAIYDNVDEDIQSVYKQIAKCFAFHHKDDEFEFEKPRDWMCCNCGNYNFSKYIAGTMDCDLKWCTLCGITQTDSIMMKLRNEDTFIMVNDNDQHTTHNTATDLYDETIEEVISAHKITLLCPNQSDKSHCISMVRLAKELMRYNEYLQSLDADKSTIKDTMPMDLNIAQFIDNNTFKIVYTESVKSIKRFTDKEKQLFLNMFDANCDNIADIETFLETDMKAFKSKTKQYLKIKPSFGSLVWKKTRRSLVQKAQRMQFGEYLSNLDMDTIDKDYHHILNTHIQNGNKDTISNAFRFFARVVHFCDKTDVVAKCRSVQRKIDRAKQMHMNDDNDTKTTTTKNAKGKKHAKDKNIWTLKQYYNQTQLDIIHSYLVHSKSKRMVKLYTMTHDIDDDDDDDDKDEDEVNNEHLIQNKDRYISFGAEYGFGVMHEHHHLSPFYPSMYHEMMFNKQCPLREIVFHNLLTKSIKKHKITLSAEYIGQFVCKYYDKRYQIIRNEAIGIRHILSIVAYTDITKFCTTFRSTYRKIRKDETYEEVTQRHIQLYHYSRALFEAIEFFGEQMNGTLTVYHGLNKAMQFKKFTAYFNQPVSTTPSFESAQRFSTDTGIILTLRSGAKQDSDLSKIPKFLSVSWLSSYPDEDERLFYGAYVVFKISNIYNISDETQQLTSNINALSILNQFQKAIQNEEVHWKNITTWQILTAWIEMRCNKIHKSQSVNTNISKYGESLFHYFCNNITWICIRNFRSFPAELFNAIFTNDDGKLSLIHLLELFPQIKEIILNDIDLDEMIKSGNDFNMMILEHVMLANDSIHIHGKYLKKISFKSKKQNHMKSTSVLQKLQNKYTKSFKRYQWSLEYQFEIENTHNLIFINEVIETADKIKKLQLNLSELQEIQKRMETERKQHQEEQKMRMKQMEQESKEKEQLIYVERKHNAEIEAKLQLTELKLQKSVAMLVRKDKELEIQRLKSIESHPHFKDYKLKIITDTKINDRREKKKAKYRKERSRTLQMSTSKSVGNEYQPKHKKTSKSDLKTTLETPAFTKHRRRSAGSDGGSWSKRKHFGETRTKMKKEKEEVRHSMKKLEKDKKIITKEKDQLTMQKQTYKKKLKALKKKHRELDEDRRLWEQQRIKIEREQLIVSQQQKQREADIQRQRSELDAEKKRWGRIQSPRALRRLTNNERNETFTELIASIQKSVGSNSKNGRKHKKSSKKHKSHNDKNFEK